MSTPTSYRQLQNQKLARLKSLLNSNEEHLFKGESDIDRIIDITAWVEDKVIKVGLYTNPLLARLFRIDQSAAGPVIFMIHENEDRKEYPLAYVQVEDHSFSKNLDDFTRVQFQVYRRVD